MSVEALIICDGCGRVINGGRTAKEARATVNPTDTCRLALPGGRDLCGSCASTEHEIRRREQ